MSESHLYEREILPKSVQMTPIKKYLVSILSVVCLGSFGVVNSQFFVGLNSNQKPIVRDPWVEFRWRPNIVEFSDAYGMLLPSRFHSKEDPKRVKIALLGVAPAAPRSIFSQTPSIPFQLERSMSQNGISADIINFGVPGHTFLHQTAMLRSYIPKFEPNALLFLIHFESIFPSWPSLAEGEDLQRRRLFEDQVHSAESYENYRRRELFPYFASVATLCKIQGIQLYFFVPTYSEGLANLFFKGKPESQNSEKGWIVSSWPKLFGTSEGGLKHEAKMIRSFLVEAVSKYGGKVMEDAHLGQSEILAGLFENGIDPETLEAEPLTNTISEQFKKLSSRH